MAMSQPRTPVAIHAAEDLEHGGCDSHLAAQRDGRNRKWSVGLLIGVAVGGGGTRRNIWVVAEVGTMTIRGLPPRIRVR